MDICRRLIITIVVIFIFSNRSDFIWASQRHKAKWQNRLSKISSDSQKAKPPLFFREPSKKRQAVIQIEADYILACQFLNNTSPAYGAINNVYGNPTWVVPRENALAILGLIEASKVLGDKKYFNRAQLAADYLVRIQDLDGGWFDQYSYDKPVLFSKSPTQTAEVMIALFKLGYKRSRYPAMKAAAEFLLRLQDPKNKGGNDDGLIGGGIDEHGEYRSYRWTSDNAFSYWALLMASQWALLSDEICNAQKFVNAAARICEGINTYLYVLDIQSPLYGVWYRVVDEEDSPVDADFIDWINYAPQMLDVPVNGVGLERVGEWIHNNLQTDDGACVWNNGNEVFRKSPGFTFQASLVWLDLRQEDYLEKGMRWAFLKSDLWQREPDNNGVKGGWIDWIEPQNQAPWWMRFIDTSFYCIVTINGGYYFGI